jgi:hypothetical protein
MARISRKDVGKREEHSGAFEPLNMPVSPSLEFIRATPLFGVHGIGEDNIPAFERVFGSGQWFRGHFFFMTEEDRKLKPDEFGLKLRLTLSVNLGHSTKGGHPSLNPGTGEIVLEKRPALVLAMAQPRMDPVGKGERGDTVGALVWDPADGAFVQRTGETFRGRHDVCNLLVKAKTVMFDDEDARHLNIAWKAHMRGSIAHGASSAASEFAGYYVSQRMAAKIFRELESEMRMRAPGTQEFPKLM